MGPRVLPHRPIYAGNAMATYRYSSPGLRMLTARLTAFQPAPTGASSAAQVEAVTAEELKPAQSCSYAAQWVGEQVGGVLTRHMHSWTPFKYAECCCGTCLSSASAFSMRARAAVRGAVAQHSYPRMRHAMLCCTWSSGQAAMMTS